MSRSRSGCHTCRIRKKKCDEQRPICGNCSSREIKCHGFGPRPRWMLGVGRNAEEMKEIRRAAAGMYQAKRSPWHEASLATRKEVVGIGASGAESVSSMECWQKETEELAAPEWHSYLTIRGAPQEPPVMTSATAIIKAPALPKELWAPPPPPPTMDSIWWHSGLQHNTDNICSKAELNLVMHYLNEVFPVIHEFHQSSSPEQGRAWVLHLLLRSKPMYWACLSLSTCHRILITDGRSMPGSKDARMLHHQTVLALKTLQTKLAEVSKLTGKELLATAFELLGSMVEVAALEVLRDIEGLYSSHWETHMSGIRSLLATVTTDPVLELALYDPTNPTKLDTIEALLSHTQPCRLHLLSSSDIDSFKYFITCFVWADILSQALDILPPSPSHQTTFRYAPLLERNIFNLTKVMGAANWAMVSIYYTNILRDWQNCCLASSGHLSPDDRVILHSRSEKISTRLESCLSQLRTERLSLTGLQLDSSLVTESFALACFVYLFVVVHGAHPAHSVVRAAFTRSLQALLSLPTRLLVRVAWPFVITGCFALEEEQALFPSMLRRATAEGKACGTCGKGLRVMRAVWAQRDLIAANKEVEEREIESGDGMSRRGVGWADGMRSMGVRVLIV